MTSENKNTASEAADTKDTSKFVPKEEYEKLAGSVKDLESKLDEAKLSLLDPDYIDFVESKRGKKVEKSVVKELSDVDTDKMTSKEILELATERAKAALMEEVLPQYEEVLKKQGATIADILAYIELGQVEKKYKDFETYRDDTRRILETSKTPLTIEQAYKQAKLDKLESEGKLKAFDEKDAKTMATEKPTGTLPKETLDKTSFKSADDAAEDAWNRVMGSGKDIL